MRGPPLSETSPPARFLLIDGLRGVAATMVMLYHFHFALRDEFARWLPDKVVGDRSGWGGRASRSSSC